MRWKHPRTGDERTQTFFALLPRRGTDGYTYWLCRVERTQEYYCWLIGWLTISLIAAGEGE